MNILVGYNASYVAKSALELARKHAKAFDGKVYVLSSSEGGSKEKLEDVSLARKELEGDQPVWVLVEPRNFSPQAAVSVEFGARDETRRPVADADFNIIRDKGPFQFIQAFDDEVGNIDRITARLLGDRQCHRRLEVIDN